MIGTTVSILLGAAISYKTAKGIRYQRKYMNASKEERKRIDSKRVWEVNPNPNSLEMIDSFLDCIGEGLAYLILTRIYKNK